jgi:hypothetical protein
MNVIPSRIPKLKSTPSQSLVGRALASGTCGKKEKQKAVKSFEQGLKLSENSTQMHPIGIVPKYLETVRNGRRRSHGNNGSSRIVHWNPFADLNASSKHAKPDNELTRRG